MRISDWSSDVCSSDLFVQRHQGLFEAPLGFGITEIAGLVQPLEAHNAGVVDQNVQVWMLASDLLGKPPDRLVLFYVELRGGHLLTAGNGLLQSLFSSACHDQDRKNTRLNSSH